jgi:hypothetical protein
MDILMEGWWIWHHCGRLKNGFTNSCGTLPEASMQSSVPHDAAEAAAFASFRAWEA